MEKFEFKDKLFGKQVEIAIYGFDEDKIEPIAKKAYEEGVRLERIFNFYDENSELNLLNKKRKLKVSSEFLGVLKFALKLCELSDGLYDISLGKNFLERKKGRPLSKLNCSYKDIRIEEDKVYLDSEEIQIDFGSIAKGYITDKIGKFLKKENVENFVINSRGDILVFGDKEQILDIQNPRMKREIVGKIIIKNSGVATSGDYEQEDHLLGGTNFSSVTVVAPNLMEADAYATVFSVVSMKKMEKILDSRKDLRVMTLDKSLRMETYNNFREIFQQSGEEADEYFSHKKLENEDEEDSSEWYIGDGPLETESKEIFVRPGREDDDEFLTGAS